MDFKKDYDVDDIREGEVWLGNTHARSWPKPEYESLKTIRVGNQAYDVHGVKLPECYKPIFIHKSEVGAYEAIMTRNK